MAPKKTTSKNAALQQLKQDLSAGTLKSTYFFFGEETYLREYYLNEVKKKLLSGGMETFNLHSLNGKDCTPDSLSTLVDIFPMMSEHSLIVVYDYDIFKSNNDDQKAYAELLGNLPDYVCIVFVYDLINIDRRYIKGDLSKLFKGTDHMVQFNTQSSGDLVDWIKRRFRALNKDIERKEAEYLIFLTGGLMTTMVSEIEKVAAYSKSVYITMEDMDAVCEPMLEAVVFKMTDALANGNFDTADRILADLLSQQQEPLMTLGAIGKQLRQLYTARIAVEQGKDAAWLMDLWGMKQSWSAEKLLTNARRFPKAWYEQAVLLAGNTDKAIKLSYGNSSSLLIDLLTRLAEAAHL